ncbi:hypothetical protein HUW62_12580 [Myxococcus sp. AM011]|uniref:hypothetical protein n=1 Tax=Myxococcus sp. AM011 TaxID=2745200 RepID=UPI001595C4AA|nr:hypothetical protein [Myxococcus sp. AM011]NVJ22055.1 hypothetical protein [Myxococcus sp. AM011]
MTSTGVRVLVLAAALSVGLVSTQAHAQLRIRIPVPDVSVVDLTVRLEVTALGIVAIEVGPEVFVNDAGFPADTQFHGQVETIYPAGWVLSSADPNCSVSGNVVTCDVDSVTQGSGVSFRSMATPPLLWMGVNHPITTRLVTGTSEPSPLSVTRYCTAITSLIVICQ